MDKITMNIWEQMSLGLHLKLHICLASSPSLSWFSCSFTGIFRDTLLINHLHLAQNLLLKEPKVGHHLRQMHFNMMLVLRSSLLLFIASRLITEIKPPAQSKQGITVSAPGNSFLLLTFTETREHA